MFFFTSDAKCDGPRAFNQATGPADIVAGYPVLTRFWESACKLLGTIAHRGAHVAHLAEYRHERDLHCSTSPAFLFRLPTGSLGRGRIHLMFPTLTVSRRSDFRTRRVRKFWNLKKKADFRPFDLIKYFSCHFKGEANRL